MTEVERQQLWTKTTESEWRWSCGWSTSASVGVKCWFQCKPFKCLMLPVGFSGFDKSYSVIASSEIDIRWLSVII